MRQANTIDEVIAILEDIVEECISNENTRGYFAALYLTVTKRIKAGIEAGEFDEPERMQRMDVIFANRYLKAYYGNKLEEPVTVSYAKAFAIADKYRPIVLQHLLVTLNAHINLDLGIAAAEVMKDEDDISVLEKDFNHVNAVLASLLDKIQTDLAEITPFLGVLLKYTGKLDDMIINFSMKLAREGAWEAAQKLAATPESQWEDAIDARDKSVAKVSDYVTQPGWLITTALTFVRLAERGDVCRKIKYLRD